MTHMQESRRPKLRPEAEKMADFCEAFSAAAAFEQEIEEARLVRQARMATEVEAELAGVQQEDGTIFVGSLADGSLVYALPEDANLRLSFNAAAAFAAQLNTDKMKGYEDWSVPTMEVMDLLYERRDVRKLRNSFAWANVNDGDYWSSTPVTAAGGNDPAEVRVKLFADGTSANKEVAAQAAVRFVRVVPPRA